MTVTETARKPLLHASLQTALTLREGVVEVRAKVDYRIHQAPCGRFVVRFPAGYKLLGVDGGQYL